MPKVAKWLGDAMDSLLGSKMPSMKVIHTEWITPNIKRIRFQGAIGGMDFQLGYAVVIRVSETEYRNYTVSYHDIDAGILEIIFHLHGVAPGTSLLNKLNTGDEIRISMPRGQKQYDPKVAQQLIFGDETSLGLACSFLPFLQEKHRFQFYFELDEVNHKAPEYLGLVNYAVFPKNGLFRDEKSIAGLPLFQTSHWKDANFILTGNAASVQTFRKVLKQYSFGGKIFSKGYWLEGKRGL